MSTWAAAYKPINLNIPSQLPQATQGKSYNYSLAARVTGGTGKPYKWSISGAKNGANTKLGNTICKSTSLKVVQGTLTTPTTDNADGTLTGSTNNEMMPTLTGTRVGKAITVTLQSRWGTRGPYSWQWNGNTISGILPAYCWDLSTFALLNEGFYTFVLQKS